MRRSDREVHDSETIRTIIERCHCCRLGLVEEGLAYIVPLNFGYAYEDGMHRLYFHSALEGRKIRLMQENVRVSFEMDTNYQMHRHEIACEYTARFQSIIGHGHVNFLHTKEEKIHGLHMLMHHNTKSYEHEFSDDMIERVAVFCLTVDAMTCKEHP